MPANKRKREIINRFNKENYINVTFRLRKELDKTIIKCLDKKTSKNVLIRDAISNEILKYECKSKDVFDEINDLRERLMIVNIICKGFFKTSIFKQVLKYYNNGVLSLDGLNIILNEFNYEYREELDIEGNSEAFNCYRPWEILNHIEQKEIALSKHGFNQEQILSSLLFMYEIKYVSDETLSTLIEAFTGIINATANDIASFKHYYNYGQFNAAPLEKPATINGIVRIGKMNEND